MRIDEGHFGDVDSSELKWAAMFAWPEAIHLGHGEGFVVIDESAGPEQREALLTILSGGETEPFATIFSVFASTMEKCTSPLSCRSGSRPTSRAAPASSRSPASSRRGSSRSAT